MENNIGRLQDTVRSASAGEAASQPPQAIDPGRRTQSARLARSSPALADLGALSLRSEAPAAVVAASLFSWDDQNLDVREAVLQKLGASTDLPAFKPLRLTNKQFSKAGALLFKGADVTAVGEIGKMAEFFKASKNIRTLRITDKGNFGNKELAQLVQVLGERGAQIEHLDLSGCYQLNDKGLTHLAGLTALRTLDLTDCYAITDGGLAHLAGLTALQTLSLSSCPAITNAGLAHLAELTALQTLNLCYCNGISEAQVSQLSARGIIVHR